MYLKESNNFIGCGSHHQAESCKGDKLLYPYNPSFYGTEEKDLSIHLVDIGYKVVFYKGVYVWHDKTSISRNLYKQHRSGVCNDFVFATDVPP